MGASEKDISNQFLMESLMLTLIGGAAGILLGFLIAVGITATGLLTASVSLSSVLIAFGVSATIGRRLRVVPGAPSGEDESD